MANKKRVGHNAGHGVPTKVIRLKLLCLDCGISQVKLGEVTGFKRFSVNLALNKDIRPATGKTFKADIEKFLSTNQKVLEWLSGRGFKMEDIWKPVGKKTGAKTRMSQPTGVGRGTRRLKDLRKGDPNLMLIDWEAEMLYENTLKKFKLFKNPFMDDVTKVGDVFMGDDHRYIEAAMLDAASNSGFLAVVGEVGSGKSIIRRKVIEILKKDDSRVRITYPQMIDKTRLNASSICDAIILDISAEKPCISHERKTRQVLRLLRERSQQGYRTCLIIEEAHDLSIQTLKYLKRFTELEDGFQKLLGIILIGQTELKHMFDESQNIHMREVIRRCTVAVINGLNGDIGNYLEFKFKRVGCTVGKVLTPDAIKAITAKLTTTDARGKHISHAYPLTVNNYVVKGMNEAATLGEDRVTEEIINSL